MWTSIKAWTRECLVTWNRFWFTPALPHTLALLRILAGGMLFYTHLVWTLALDDFLGPTSFITSDVSRALHRDNVVWSYLWYIDSPLALRITHFVGLAVFALLTLGCWTRVMSVLACIMTLSYCHRLNGALFGLDQVNAMMAMYLMLGPSGAVYSLDRWRALRRGAAPSVRATISANIAIRLMQTQLCIIYLFGGIGKLRGEMWWDGSAVWYAFASYEYQSLDMTWLANWPWVIALMAHVTVFWETFYFALVWNRLSRPLALLLAVCVHGGIALCLGMVTFGTAMIIANASFLPPERVRTWLGSRP